MTDCFGPGVALSRAWCAYFVANGDRAENLPWDDARRLTIAERRAVEHSIQQFQLGEGAEGRRLLARGHAHARAVCDPLFPEALLLFIREEQRHSAQLLRFMQLQGIAAVEKHWVDSVFRWVRVLAGLELELRVLVTAEIIAVPYYRALGGATRSRLLQALSAKILEDEAGHLRFQASMLSRISEGRSRTLHWLVWLAHRLFLVCTCCVVWVEHSSVFKAAGHSYRGLLRDAVREFSSLEAASRLQNCREPGVGAAQGERSEAPEFVSIDQRSAETLTGAEASESQLQ